MEYALREPNSQKQIKKSYGVLILVLMEYASRGDLTKSNSLSLDTVNKSPLHSLNRLFLIARNICKSFLVLLNPLHLLRNRNPHFARPVAM